MPAVAAYNTTVKVSGTSTAFTNAACTGAGTSWQISDTSKQVFDPAVTPTWSDNGTPISSGDIASVDYLTGSVVFTASKTGPITVSGSYLPLLTVSLAYSATVAPSADSLDVSVFGSQWRQKIQGLKTLALTLENYHLPSDDLDPGAGTRKFQDLFDNGTVVLIEVDPGGLGAGNRVRAYGVLMTEDASAAIDGIVTNSVQFESTVVTAADGTKVSIALDA